MEVKQQKKKKTISFTHVFEKKLCTDVFVVALNELLKHLLFVRYQIPQPLISIQKDMKYEEQKYNEECDVKFPRNTNHKKWLQKSCFVTRFLEITSSLSKIIMRCRINKVVLLFGSTVISPKETVVIHVDQNIFNDADKENMPVEEIAVLTSLTCCRLMQAVVTSDQFNDLKEVSPQNIFVLVNFRDTLLSNDHVFLPKLNYRLPSRGIVHNIYLKSKIADENNMFIGTASHHTDISNNKFLSSSLKEDDALYNAFNELGIREQFERHWYQANVSLRGFKEKSAYNNGTEWF